MKDSIGGILLLVAMVLALVAANSPLSAFYEALLSLPFTIQLGDVGLSKPLLLWINDGLMAIFFFMVGLELKREFLEGSLSQRSQLVLPLVAALGGMLVPGAIYAWWNWNDATSLQGWAIPTATDIAFALGILGMLGSRIPPSLKIFLTVLAIFDDLGAILIIAIFYSGNLSMMALLIALVSFLILFSLNHFKVYSVVPYLLVGLILWTSLLKSGEHATIAGVLVAMTIPMNATGTSKPSSLKWLEHQLHPWVTLLILPIFAFANSGIPLLHVQMSDLIHSVPIGIASGLFIGKQLGVFLFSALVIRLGFAKMPEGANWSGLYGVAVLCGIGFTMSLFIGSLAFEASGNNRLFDERIGILAGSFFSGILGYFILRWRFQKTQSIANSSN